MKIRVSERAIGDCIEITIEFPQELYWYIHYVVAESHTALDIISWYPVIGAALDFTATKTDGGICRARATFDIGTAEQKRNEAEREKQKFLSVLMQAHRKLCSDTKNIHESWKLCTTFRLPEPDNEFQYGPFGKFVRKKEIAVS